MFFRLQASYRKVSDQQQNSCANTWNKMDSNITQISEYFNISAATNCFDIYLGLLFTYFLRSSFYSRMSEYKNII